MFNNSRRKGQNQVVEEVLLFGLGLMIVVGFIVVFGEINDAASEEIQENGLTQVNNYIASKISEIESLEGNECSFTIKIPKYIGGTNYIILGSSNENKSIIYNENEMWIEKEIPLKLTGKIDSVNGKVRLDYSAGEVFLNDVSYY